MSYEVYYEKRALKEFQQFDKKQRERIRAAIDRFARERRGDVKPIRGFRYRFWELRIGPFRAAFILEGNVMKVLRVWRK